jgi:hypothetical protein
MKIVICPGVHGEDLTQHFLLNLQRSSPNIYHPNDYIVFPSYQYPAYSAFHVLQFVFHQLGLELPPYFLTHKDGRSPVLPPLLFISFSAGVVGAIGAAWAWKLMGGQVIALIAFDGWGVPLYGDFPIHRVGRDAFSFWTSALLGGGTDSFYAVPEVAHLDLWRSPHLATGVWVHPPDSNPKAVGLQQTTWINAADFVVMLLNRYTHQK